MPSPRIAIRLNAGSCYHTLTVQRWYTLFDRCNCWQIMSDSIHYCQDNINGYPAVTNQIKAIKMDLVAISFTPRHVAYKTETNKVLSAVNSKAGKSGTLNLYAQNVRGELNKDAGRVIQPV